jgi:hypothetical protein
MRLSLESATACVLFVGVISGCSWSPYNGQTFATRSTPVPFQGCSLGPDHAITLEVSQAAPFTGSPGWITVPEFAVRSSATPSYADSAGVSWYCWQQTIKFTNYWGLFSFGTRPHLASLVRILDNGNPEYTYNNVYSDCSQAAGSNQLTNAAPCALQPENSGAAAFRPGAIAIFANDP